jgi:hypothetical protein
LTALGIQKKRVMRIPTPIDSKMIEMIEVSNFQKKKFIVIKGTDEFWIAKTAIHITIINTIQ